MTRRSDTSRGWLAALVLLLLLAPSRAFAQSDDARTLFAEGRRLRQAGKCAEAIDAFRRALRAAPEGLGSLRNIAQCQEELGRYASARRSWWDLRREALKSDAEKYDDWENHAEKAHARLDALVPRLTIRLRGAAPSDVRVTVNGEELAPELVGAPLERDVGEHEIVVWHDDSELAVETVLLDASQREEITLDVELPTEEPPTREPERGNDTMLAAGIALTGVGVLGLAGAVVAGVVRGNALSELEQCPAYPKCPPSERDTRDRGRTATTLVNVFAIAGGIATAGGIGLVLAGVFAPASSVEVQAVATPTGGAMFRARVRF
jgi:hypothetical protein